MPVGDWTNGGCADAFVTSVISVCMMSMVLVLWGVGFIVGNGYGI